MSPQSEKSHLAVVHSPEEFSPGEREELLALAHEAILSVLEARELAATADSRFASPRAAFTTIYLRGSLRGCVGYAFPIAPLWRTIIETARGAAFEDPRFPAVTLTEARELAVSLSILSTPCPLPTEQIEIGTHGLLISMGGRRGLLLPQVAAEHGWDRTAFLEQTCRKAGLSPDAWKLGATIEGFTAEIFGDREGL